ncbi:MAG: hypothetical protein ACYCOU_10370, partial [Sulfobacillus sp.]
KVLLCWVQPQYALVARDAKGAFSVQHDDRLLGADGQSHGKYATFAEYQHELLLRSTEILFPIEPAATVCRTFPVPYSASEGVTPAGPAWPHTHTLDVASDAVFIDTGTGVVRLDLVTITGYLQWQRSNDKPLYYVIEHIPTGEAFSGALIATEMREGHMTALVFSPKTREIGVHFVRLAEKHHNAIRRLKLEFSARTA